MMPLVNDESKEKAQFTLIFPSAYVLFILFTLEQIKLEVEFRTHFYTETQLHFTYYRQPDSLHTTFQRKSLLAVS